MSGDIVLGEDRFRRCADGWEMLTRTPDVTITFGSTEATERRWRQLAQALDKIAAERAEVERLTDRIATLCAAGDALADSLQRSEEQFYAHWFEEGVVNEKVREYVSGHSALAAFKEARRER